MKKLSVLGLTLTLGLSLISSMVHAQDYSGSNQRAHIWPTIPFVRGADLCKYQNAYGQTKSEYIREMSSHAQDLMQAGAYGPEALMMLIAFDEMYDKNIRNALGAKHIEVTLENTLKAYVDQFYKDIGPREKKISFRHLAKLKRLVQVAKNGQRVGDFDDSYMDELDYMAYGSYAMAPNCRGNIQVTLTLVGKGGHTLNFVAEGRPNIVMSTIASRLFEHFQRTRFPTTLRVGRNTITLFGGSNGFVDTVTSPDIAELICETQGGRLPTEREYNIINAYGSWSGGVSIGTGKEVWAMSNNRVFHPGLRNPSPVRGLWEVNARKFYYFCVK